MCPITATFVPVSGTPWWPVATHAAPLPSSIWRRHVPALRRISDASGNANLLPALAAGSGQFAMLTRGGQPARRMLRPDEVQ